MATPHEIVLTPNYAVIRERFGREARDRADTILADLIPEHLIEPEHIKAVQRAVLAETGQLLNAIDAVTQATTNLEQLIALRKLTHDVAQAIIKKADAIEAGAEQIRCDQCEALMIQGVFCHEAGCPNAKKRYEGGEWVRYLKCHECGSEVREGETCCEWPELTVAE